MEVMGLSSTVWASAPETWSRAKIVDWRRIGVETFLGEKGPFVDLWVRAVANSRHECGVFVFPNVAVHGDCRGDRAGSGHDSGSVAATI